ncbi:MAG TPA: c-type cytochrome [Solirubrobacterales bacterium]|nr:c-type cytochrome [Solirubrobacterales bacterium]
MRAPVPKSRRLALLPAAALLLVLPGCDLQENADTQNGRQLFIETCGTCHALTEAGTQAEIGPNLDSAFLQARKDGMDQDTIEGVVEGQIENPRVTNPDNPSYMPAGLLEGEDATDVAAYVASVAGVPGVEPPIPPGAPPGAQVFLAQGCSSCHTLAAAGATGAVGPNLDETLPGQDPKQIEESIVDPSAQLAQGFGGGIMPQTYGQDLTPQELQDLVDFLSGSAGKQPK